MSKELDGVRTKIARASEHLDSLKDSLDAWRREKPYCIVVEIDPQSQEQSFKVADDPVIPATLPVIGDILYNLRSALDHLAWQLVIKAGGTPTSRTEYPIFLDPDKWRSDSPRKMAGMNQAMKERIEAHQPCLAKHIYRDRAFWALHEYGNTDKHRALLTVPVSTEDLLWQPGGNPVYHHKGPVRKGTVLATFPAGQHQSYLGAMPSIAFSEPPAENEEVHRTLHFMEFIIENLVDEFEAAFF